MSNVLQGQILALILVASVVGCLFIGLGRGLVYGIYSVVKNILIVVAAVSTAPVIVKQLPDTLVAKEGIAYAAALAVSIVLFNLIGSFIKSVRDVPLVGGLDRFGGGVAGLVVGFIVAWSVLAVLGCFQEYEWCKEIVQSSRENRIVMWFQTTSPLPAVLEIFKFPVV